MKMHSEEFVSLSPSPTRRFAFGSSMKETGVEYRAWHPATKRVEVLIWRSGRGTPTIVELLHEGEGWYGTVDPRGSEGDEYLFRLDGETMICDPAARRVTDVNGRAIVCQYDLATLSMPRWPLPPMRDLVFYEIHVGTLSSRGTFAGVAERLPHLQNLGINAIELMPVCEFLGRRNWGYDGALPYCPAGGYGGAAGLRALVQAAHEHGIAVFLDVVYNHAGPGSEHIFGHSKEHFLHDEGIWGRTFNFDGPASGPVRQFFIENAIYWIEGFDLDGLRLDATHAIHDASETHILTEITAELHKRGRYAIAEDDRNLASLILPVEEGGHGFDAVWADDFHHVMRTSQTRESDGYYLDYNGSASQLADTVRHGWLYRGQISPYAERPRGSPCQHLPPQAFVHCISNHDQVGNRPFGDRLFPTVSGESYRAMSAALCFTPYTPLLFMGQEWGASSPFQFFTDFSPELGKAVTEGRRNEFARFRAFGAVKDLASIPDPQDEQTYLCSRLNWEEIDQPPHAALLNLYRECLSLRREIPSLRPQGRDGWSVGNAQGMVYVLFWDQHVEICVLIALRDQYFGPFSHLIPLSDPTSGQWELVFSSNMTRFGGTGEAFTPDTQTLSISGPETLMLKRAVEHRADD
jgi:maltooligosyltrehalose trehalohydrolase